MILFICKIKKGGSSMKKMLFKNVNYKLIGEGLVNTYKIREYVNNKDYETINRNISSFS